MEYSGFFDKWNKIVNSLAINAINTFQKKSQGISKIVNPPALSAITAYEKNTQAISKIVNSPASIIIKEQQSLWDNALSFNKALKAADVSSLRFKALSQTPFTKNQLLEIQNILEPSKSFFSSITNNNLVFNSFSNSGVFSAISFMSKNISAITAIEKIKNLSSLINPLDYDIRFSNDNDILVDDEKLSVDEVLEFAKEFEQLPLDFSNPQISIVKLKSNKGKFFLTILWIILFNLLFEPLVGDFFQL